jgi:hypothetical protein
VDFSITNQPFTKRQFCVRVFIFQLIKTETQLLYTSRVSHNIGNSVNFAFHFLVLSSPVGGCYSADLSSPDFFGASGAKHIRKTAAWLPAEFCA